MPAGCGGVGTDTRESAVLFDTPTALVPTSAFALEMKGAGGVQSVAMVPIRLKTACFRNLWAIVHVTYEQSNNQGDLPVTWRAAFIVVPLAFAVSACGDNWGERAVTGGGMGAGSGLVLGAVAGWPLLAPVLVGAAVGAGIGAATTPGKEFKF